MSFEEFQNKARLYVLGALDDEDRPAFEEARRQHGALAENFIQECRKLNSIFALSLRPSPPRPETKQKLMARVRDALRKEADAHHLRQH